MSFDTPPFLIFIGIVVLGTYVLRSEPLRHGWLLAASYVFYGAWDYRFLSLIVFISLASYYGTHFVAGLKARGGNWRVALAVLVGLLLAPLAVFKYLNFFAGSAANLSAFLGFPVGWAALNIVLPVGISFYTFQALSYVLDVIAGRLRQEDSVVRYALFIAFFPQLVAGPIVRASDFLPQLHAPWQPPSRRECAQALTRFLWGFFKKVFIADRLATAIVDPVFASPDAASPAFIALGAVGFGLLIYADFSAYSDMAIATARILGYRLRENFLSPYWAVSMRDFWRRWHVSLSSWIRDYVYIPLGGSRGGPVATYANLMIAMVLFGLWHGAAWTFVLWGAMHGLALAVERLLGFNKPDRWLAVALGWLWCHAVVYVGWLVFRADGFHGLVAMAAGLVAGAGDAPAPPLALLAFVAAAGLILYAEQAALYWARRREVSVEGARLGAVLPQVTAAVCLSAVMLLITYPDMGSRNFVYFQF
jgi:D-alanyl-lipoteichoic acid acyltransferase DltB (MBOAT superfamily)